MSTIGIRPNFTQHLPLPPDEAQASIVGTVRSESEDFEVKSFPGFVCVRIPTEERHFWSPRLNLSLEPEDDGSTRIEGIYGPNANVWSLFLYGYLITASFAIFGGSLGFAQWQLGRTAWGLWIFWTSLILIVALYLLARIGRKLGAPQTARLHQLYELAIGRTVELQNG
ncbi:hypothetical protein [Luteolibacter marinus]|uniref:hypothetical protein n=1 Tax=Luteolibacter marinus TaxID=2776705 RepID=UPI0018689169|nr:hypothetical protein [Luteolibacter marinus]